MEPGRGRGRARLVVKVHEPAARLRAHHDHGGGDVDGNEALGSLARRRVDGTVLAATRRCGQRVLPVLFSSISTIDMSPQSWNSNTLLSLPRWPGCSLAASA